MPQVPPNSGAEWSKDTGLVLGFEICIISVIIIFLILLSIAESDGQE